MDPNSPFDDGGVDPMLYLEAAKRKARLEAATRNDTFPTNAPPSRFVQPPPSGEHEGGILELLSRFLHPGQQTTPSAPKFQAKEVEDETRMK